MATSLQYRFENKNIFPLNLAPRRQSNAITMRLKKNIATSESGFIFNPGTGDSYSANPLAAEILLQLKEGIPAAEIKQQLLERYDVAPGVLEKDWDDFTAQLREANLLEY